MHHDVWKLNLENEKVVSDLRTGFGIIGWLLHLQSKLLGWMIGRLRLLPEIPTLAPVNGHSMADSSWSKFIYGVSGLRVQVFLWIRQKLHCFLWPKFRSHSVSVHHTLMVEICRSPVRPKSRGCRPSPLKCRIKKKWGASFKTATLLK